MGLLRSAFAPLLYRDLKSLPSPTPPKTLHGALFRVHAASGSEWYPLPAPDFAITHTGDDDHYDHLVNLRCEIKWHGPQNAPLGPMHVNEVLHYSGWLIQIASKRPFRKYSANDSRKPSCVSCIQGSGCVKSRAPPLVGETQIGRAGTAGVAVGTFLGAIQRFSRDHSLGSSQQTSYHPSFVGGAKPLAKLPLPRSSRAPAVVPLAAVSVSRSHAVIECLNDGSSPAPNAS